MNQEKVGTEKRGLLACPQEVHHRVGEFARPKKQEAMTAVKGDHFRTRYLLVHLFGHLIRSEPVFPAMHNACRNADFLQSSGAIKGRGGGDLSLEPTGGFGTPG